MHSILSLERSKMCELWKRVERTKRAIRNALISQMVQNDAEKIILENIPFLRFYTKSFI